MKKILFVINSLDGGGAEKSLISLLHELEKYKTEYQIDLLLPSKQGLFFGQIPSYVRQVGIPEPLFYMTNSYKTVIAERKCNFKWVIKKIMWSLKNKNMRKFSSGVVEQEFWKYWGKSIPSIGAEEYDVAVGYLNGYPNYLVIDKVKAKRKVLWVHNEYQKLGYDKTFDKDYYEKADVVVTISELCVDDFLKVFPNLKNKVVILQNITSGHLIRKLAGVDVDDFDKESYKAILLSIGRLVEQKNYKLAIETAEYLKNNYKDFSFIWYIMGKGPLKKILERKIKEKGLDGYLVLMGVRQNPYPYIKRADIFVQTSIYEGKSIVLDEAKIMGKPIVVTDYATVFDSIENEKTGFIVRKRPEEIAQVILKIMNSPKTRLLLNDNLQQFKEGNSYEINKYIEVLLGNEK